jgi:hypothetical protein
MYLISSLFPNFIMQISKNNGGDVYIFQYILLHIMPHITFFQIDMYEER